MLGVGRAWGFSKKKDKKKPFAIEFVQFRLVLEPFTLQKFNPSERIQGCVVVAF